MTQARSCVVFDTSTLIGCCITPHGKPAQALAYALRQHVLAISHATQAELVEVFNRDKFNAWRAKEQRLVFLNAILKSAQMLEVVQRVTDCRDPKDNKFLELALSAKASALVSSNSDLLVLHPYRGIPIVTPANFLATA
jgi:uncharacterized protein